MKHLHQIVLPAPIPVGTVNVWLLDGAEPTLIDTGFNRPKSLAALESGLGALGRELADIKRILITHGHNDHAGAARLLSRQCRAPLCLPPKSTILAGRQPEMLERLFAFLRRCGIPEELLGTARSHFQRAAGWTDLETEPYGIEWLADGETLAINGRSLKVLHTPGHSPDHVCLLDEESRGLICGDTLLADITPNPVLYMDPDDDYRRAPSLLQYMESLWRLKGLNATIGYPGHGRTITGVNALIEQREDFVEQRRDLILDKLCNGSRTPYELAVAVFGLRDPMNLFLAVSETVAYLDLFERDRLAVVDWRGATISIG